MLSYINHDELRLLAKDFYTITNILISIFDENGNFITGYPGRNSPLCNHVRTIPDLTFRCYQCDKAAINICRKTGKSHFYHCHMGLVEVVTPILSDYGILGYVLFGQITDSTDTSQLRERALSTAREYHLDQTAMLNSIRGIRFCSEEYIRSTTRLLEMCANYIWLHNIMIGHKEDLAFQLSQHIRLHLRDALSVQTLCRRFSIGTSTLYTLSLNSFGCSIKEYITRVRMEHAKDLLSATTLSVSEVAEQCGYPDDNYFIRTFKRRTGCTPGAYRRSFAAAK